MEEDRERFGLWTGSAAGGKRVKGGRMNTTSDAVSLATYNVLDVTRTS